MRFYITIYHDYHDYHGITSTKAALLEYLRILLRAVISQLFINAFFVLKFTLNYIQLRNIVGYCSNLRFYVVLET